MIPQHLFCLICISRFEQDDCTQPKCGELTEYTDSAHTVVKSFFKMYEWFSRCFQTNMNTLKVRVCLYSELEQWIKWRSTNFN